MFKPWTEGREGDTPFIRFVLDSSRPWRASAPMLRVLAMILSNVAGAIGDQVEVRFSRFFTRIHGSFHCSTPLVSVNS